MKLDQRSMLLLSGERIRARQLLRAQLSAMHRAHAAELEAEVGALRQEIVELRRAVNWLRDELVRERICAAFGKGELAISDSVH